MIKLNEVEKFIKRQKKIDKPVKKKTLTKENLEKGFVDKPVKVKEIVWNDITKIKPKRKKDISIRIQDKNGERTVKGKILQMLDHGYAAIIPVEGVKQFHEKSPHGVITHWAELE